MTNIQHLVARRRADVALTEVNFAFGPGLVQLGHGHRPGQVGQLPLALAHVGPHGGLGHLCPLFGTQPHQMRRAVWRCLAGR